MARLEGRWHWVALAAAIGLLLLLVIGGVWRATGTGPQVQVPMFYDAHYLYPRPWTQEQEAPGVPEPASLAFFGRNHISQPFTSAVDRLSSIELWLDGAAGTEVEVSLSALDSAENHTATVLLDGSGRYHQLMFPSIANAANRPFILTLSAPSASREQPVLTHTVGGDRIGGSIMINEYSRPGNLELFTYVDRAMIPAVVEQLLPDTFQLRLQQYKPDWLKGNLFGWLLLGVVVLSLAFFVLSLPAKYNRRHALVWTVALLLFCFVGWQLVSGRVVVADSGAIMMTPAAAALPVSAEPDDAYRLFNDLATVLWTTDRAPEKRWAVATVGDAQSVIDVPGNFRIEHGMVVPPASRLLIGIRSDGPATARVLIGDTVVTETTVQADAAPIRLEIDLSPWAGLTQLLSLQTESTADNSTVQWIQPQLETRALWLLPDQEAIDGMVAANYVFGDTIELLGYTLTEDALVLYWRIAEPTVQNPTVFVHFLDGDGDLVAQDDAPPLRGAYPVSVWQPQTIIADTRPLPPKLSPGTYDIAVGLYDSADFVRWPVVDSASQPQPDDRAILPDISIGE